jgi:hypothetical protein
MLSELSLWSEEGIQAFSEVKDNDMSDPESERSLFVARGILYYIGGGAFMFDPAIVKENGKPGLYDERSQEYRSCDSRYIYVVPRGVILGTNQTVERRPYVSKGSLDKLFNTLNKVTYQVGKHFFIKGDFLKWGDSDTRILNRQVLQNLREKK